ncbi:MAG: hypothetical protein WCV84_04725 [Patescibacteria group bacterium]
MPKHALKKDGVTIVQIVATHDKVFGLGDDQLVYEWNPSFCAFLLIELSEEEKRNQEVYL